MEVVASLSQGRTAAAQCGLFTQKSVPVIFEPPCNIAIGYLNLELPLTIVTELKYHAIKFPLPFHDSGKMQFPSCAHDISHPITTYMFILT